MKITEKEVRYVADLSNLQLTGAEVVKLQADLNGILEHMDKLKEIDTTGVEPMAQVLFDAGETATLRADSRGRRWATSPPWPARRSPAEAISKCPGLSNAEPWAFKPWISKPWTFLL